jgi:hypothetical protein
MSTVWIAVLLIVPIVAVVMALNLSNKRQKKKIDKRNSLYLQQVMEQTGIVSSFQKQLTHQLVIVDDVSRRLLVIDHVDNTYSHVLYELDDIKDPEIINVKQVIPGYDNNKSESFTSHIGVQLISGNGTNSKQLLVFYDHVKHSLYLMTEMQQEARKLQQRIRQAKTKKQLAAN